MAFSRHLTNHLYALALKCGSKNSTCMWGEKLIDVKGHVAEFVRDWVGGGAMGSIVLKTLSILLGLFFVFVGLIKLTPLLNAEMHKEMRKTFVHHTKVFPVPLDAFGIKLTSKWYRRTVGGIELFGGLSLLILPGIFKKLANISLLILMLGAVYSHYAIGDRFERMAPALVFSFMLTCRLVVSWQVKRKQSQPAAGTAAAKKSN